MDNLNFSPWSVIQTFKNVINNELVGTATTRHTVNPSTEEPLWEVPVSTQEDVDRAVSAAKAAFPAWSKLSQDERAGYLNKFADAIEANTQSFAELLGKEVGKPPQAGGFELYLTMGLAREIPKLRLKYEKKIDDADVSDENCLFIVAAAI
jgi:acyl-CoA reductase-like NAD-dependent aldehyde dehydrogenase